VPGLLNLGDWGKIQNGDLSKELLFTHLAGLVSSLNQGKSAVDDTIELATLSEEEAGGFALTALNGALQIKKAAQNPDVVAKVELLVSRWASQISHVITVSEHIRSEPDDAGPRVELAFWKHRTAVFNSLLDEVKRPNCIVAIQILQLAKSKLLTRWRELDIELTDRVRVTRDANAHVAWPFVPFR
jgi:dynein heavy chain